MHQQSVWMISWYTVKPRLIIVHVFTENVSLNNRLGSFILDMSLLTINWTNFTLSITFCFLPDMVLTFQGLKHLVLRQLISSSSFEKHDGMIVVFEL